MALAARRSLRVDAPTFVLLSLSRRFEIHAIIIIIIIPLFTDFFFGGINITKTMDRVGYLLLVRKRFRMEYVCRSVQ